MNINFKKENINLPFTEKYINHSWKELVNSVDERLDEIRYRLGVSGNMKNWLNKSEVSIYTGLSVSSINKLMSKGELPYSKIGTSVRFHILDVEQVMSMRINVNSFKCVFSKRLKMMIEKWGTENNT